MDRRFVDPHAADVDRQGADLRAGRRRLGGDALVDLLVEETHTCYLGDRSHRHAWGYGCGECPACRLRAHGFAKWKAESDSRMTTRRDRRRQAPPQREGLVFLVLFALTIPLANWMIGHVGTVCVPQGPCLIPVAPELMAPSGVLMIGVALVLRDLVQRRLGTGVVGAGDPGRRRPVGAARAAGAGDRLGGRLPAVGTGRSRRLHAAGAPAAARGGRRLERWSAWWSTRSCSCGSPSARSTSWPAR